MATDRAADATEPRDVEAIAADSRDELALAGQLLRDGAGDGRLLAGATLSAMCEETLQRTPAPPYAPLSRRVRPPAGAS